MKAKIKQSLSDKKLLIICDPTEFNYFEGLQSNSLFRNKMNKVKILDIQEEVKHGNASSQELIGMIELGIIKQKQQSRGNEYDEIWIVADNDKRNAYILDKKSLTLLNQCLPNSIYTSFVSAVAQEQLKYFTPARAKEYTLYFFSKKDYLDFISGAIGASNAITYLEIFLHNTEHPKQIESFISTNPYEIFMKKLFYGKGGWHNLPNFSNFDVDWKKYIKMAYSCLSFEFWLVLHFQQNITSFSLVAEQDETEENSKALTPQNVYLRRYLQDLYQIANNNTLKYSKGRISHKDQSNGVVRSYNILKSSPFSKNINEENIVLSKIQNAIQNAKNLRANMLNSLQIHNGKWFEVNPYIYQLDELVEYLLT